MSTAPLKQLSDAESLKLKYRPAVLGSDPKRGLAIVRNVEVFKKAILDIPDNFEIVIAGADQLYAPDNTPPLRHSNYLFNHVRGRKEVLLFGNGGAGWLKVMRNMLSEANAREVRLSQKPDMSLVHADDTAPPDFDYEALPSVWARWTKEMAEAKGCPVDYVAAALLVSASAWLGNSRRVAPTYDWIEPPHLWIAQIGKPSEGKTPSQQPFIEVSKTLEREEEPGWQEILNKHESDMETANAKLGKWKDEVKQAVKDNATPPNRPLDAAIPNAPPPPRILTIEGTTQKIQNLLSGNPKGLLQVRDELAGWIGGFDRYGGAGADRGFYLETWNGGFYTVDLVKHDNGPIRIPYASLSIMGGLQPDKLLEALAGADDGFAARFGYVWPKAIPPRPLRADTRETSEARFSILMNAGRRMRRLAMQKKDDGSSVAKILRLSTAALGLFEKLRSEAIEKARSTRGLAAGWHGKTPARALRLALTIEFLAWAANPDAAGPEEISGTSMACAGAYLDYLAAMFERVIGGIAVGRAEADAADIARHILKTKPDCLNERNLYQTTGFSYLRDTQRRRAALEILERGSWIFPTEHDSRGRPRGDWKVSDYLTGDAP